MLYLVVERFHPGKLRELYDRFDRKGRMLPEGVSYINSWINGDMTTCYQVMEAENADKLNEWISNWSDLADFEIIPVVTSAEARDKALSGHQP